MLNAPLGRLGTSGGLGLDLLAQALGDAGGIKYWHGPDGTLYDNDLGGGSYSIRKSAYYWDGSAWALGGLLQEPASTNEIRNNTMQGGVAGSDGTVPTNWSLDASENGLTRTLSFGTEDGMEYIGVQYAGTTTAASFLVLAFEITQQIAALQNETWSHRVYMKLHAGTTTGITNLQIALSEHDSGGSFLATNVSADQTSNLSSTIKPFSISPTLGNASTAYVQPAVNIFYADATAVDFTIRFYVPQCEEKGKPTSVIKTTSAAVARVADPTAIQTFTQFDATQGMIVCEARPSEIQPGDDQWMWCFYEAAGPANNRIGTFVDDSQANAGRNSYIAGASGEEWSSTSMFSGDETWGTIATGWSNSRRASSANGGAVTASTTVTGPPTGIDTFNIGGRNAHNQAFCGFIRKLTYYPYTPTDAELQDRSA